MTADKIKNKFLGTSLTGSYLAITRLLVGLVKVKTAAIWLGVGFVGLLSQGNELLMLGVSSASLMLSAGLTTCIKGAKSQEEAQEYLQSAFSMQIVVLVFVLFGAFIWSENISNWAFGDAKYSAFIILLAICLPFYAYASNFLHCLFFAYDRYATYVLASIISTVISGIAFVSFVYFEGIKGAFWGLSLSGFVHFACFFYYTKDIRKGLKLFAWRIDKTKMTQLFQFGLAMLFYQSGVQLSQLVVRSELIHQEGLISNGLLQVPIALTAYYIPFLTNGLWGHLHPFVAEHKDTTKSHQEMNQVLHSILSMQCVFALGLLAFGPLLIRLMYTGEFSPAFELLPYQLPGDFFHVLFFSFSVYFLALSKLKRFFFAWTVYYAIYLGLAFYLIPSMGKVGIPTAYGISNFIVASLCLVYFFKKLELLQALKLIGFAATIFSLILFEIWIVKTDAHPLAVYILPITYILYFGSKYLNPSNHSPA